MNVYPKCARSFMEYISSDKKLLNKYMINNIIKIRPFDVTLRDGLQGLSIEEHPKFTTEYKQELYNYIVQKYNPINVEIGSCVNKNLLPIFNDTEELFNYAELNTKSINNYVLIPNKQQLVNSIHMGIKNFSFITSVSNNFQCKNTRMTLSENYSNLNNMMQYLHNSSIQKYNVKLYVSCINECPFEGKIHTHNIVSEIFSLSLLNFNTICLSDTCGSLTHEEFIDIIENIKKVGIDTKKLSLHLHINPDNEAECEKIVHCAIDNGIIEFDVSAINSGGCSVAMDKTKLLPNMSYEQYYKFLTTYLIHSDNY